MKQEQLNQHLDDAIDDEDLAAIRQWSECGAEVNVGKRRSRFAPLDRACAHGGSTGMEMIQHLLEHGANVNYDGFGEGTPLTFAAGNGDIERLRLFLKAGAGVNVAPEQDGQTALHLAVRRNQVEAVKLLLGAGADVDKPARVDAPTESSIVPRVWGETALHFAAGWGGQEVIELLLAAGADSAIQTANGETPLAYAKRHERPVEIIRLLTDTP